MNEKEQLDMELDDILKEFAQQPETEEEQEISAQSEEMEAFLEEQHEADVQAEALREELSVLQAKVADMGDTIRLDTIAAVLGSQSAADAVEKTREQEENTEEVPTMPAGQDEKQEPYSEGWEPEYEQPIGEYVPPRPIQFHPPSRLRELKRQLVAGPERRYYELSGMGLGRLQGAIFLSLLVFAMSAGATALHAAGYVSDNRIKLMVFGQFFALLLSALLGRQQILSGIGDVFHLRFSLNSTLIFTFIACVVDGLFCLRELRVPCCAAFCLQITMSLWASYHRRVTEMGQMDTMRKAIRLDSIVPQPDYYEGHPGLLRGEGQVDDFMQTYDQCPTTEKALSVYALVALLISIAAGATAGILHGSVSFGAQVLAASLLAAVPVSTFISQTRPAAILEKRLHRVGAVLCGWQGVRAMCGKVFFPLGHEDLFPAGSFDLNGVKFYGDRDPDEVVAYAAALIRADGGGLVPLFEYLLDSRNGRHYDAEKLRAYTGGIGGEIEDESVLVGTSDFLKAMGVDIPQGIRVSQAVYVAIDGELCGLVAVSYAKDKATAAGLGVLCAARKLWPVLISGDFLLTEGFLRSRLNVNTRRMRFPERSVRQTLSEKEPDDEQQAAALVTETGLAPLAYVVAGARSLRTAAIMGVVIHMIGGIVGLLMMVALAVLGAQHLLTPSNMLLYQLVWLVPGLLLTEWTRAV